MSTIAAAAQTADRIDYWIRRRVVRCPPLSKVDPAFDRYIALTAIGRSLKDQYNVLATPIPPQLAALVEQLKTQQWSAEPSAPLVH
jgi:hypothetical protein